MPTFKERIDKHDREIGAIRKLIHTGMKMFVKAEEEHKVFRAELRELRASQRETDRQLQTFIRSLRRGSNGHSKN